MSNNKLSNIQNLVIGGISSMSMISVYVAGVNLSKIFDSNSIPIFISGSIFSCIIPHVTHSALTKTFTKYNNKRSGGRNNE